MRVDVVTLFPELFEPHLRTSLLGKAVQERRLEIVVHDLRAHGLGKHRSVDDEPYGGGPGMVMRPDPIFAAVEPLRSEVSKVVLLTPRGERLVQEHLGSLAEEEHLILICGRYEGIDERVSESLVDVELSLGDFVLAGGELPALAVIEGISRLLPGVLGNAASLETESHAEGLLEHPQYTRPAEFRGMPVPAVLLSGDHAAIAAWRRERAEEITRRRRPDLLGDD